MAYGNPIRVLILHADPVAREGLTSAFGRCADLAPVEHDAQAPSPVGPPDAPLADVVVADLGHAMAYLRQTAARPASRGKVLVIASACREWEIRSALECGARGYVVVGCGLDELAIGVRAVHRGQRYLSPQAALRLAEVLACDPLTAREEEVLRLLVEGLGNKLIARRLGIALGTVKSHLKGVFEKLQVQSRTQAICAAERRGLLRDAPASSDFGGSGGDGYVASATLPPFLGRGAESRPTPGY
jgi:DNA-binding NarL/FixJ family response regulator